MSFTPSKVSTPPGGVWAGDFETHDAEPAAPVQQFKGGATVNGSEFTRNVHATSEVPVSLPPAPPGAKLSFKSESGQTILGRQAQLHDRVIVPGIGETTVQSALMMNAIVEEPGGGFSLPDQQEAPSRSARDVSREVDHEDALAAGPEGDRDAGHVDAPDGDRQPLLPEHEAHLEAVREHIGQDDFDAALAHLVEDELPPEHLLDRLSASLGTSSREEVISAIAHVTAPMTAQAHAVIDAILGEGQAEAVFEAARQNPTMRTQLKRAMEAQARRRSVREYRDLATMYVAHLGKTRPQVAAEALTRAGARVRVRQGKVLIDMGKGRGEVELVSGLRSGVVKIGRGRK